MAERRILYIANDGEITGGGAVSLGSLIKCLDKKRFSPFVICPYRGSFVELLDKENIVVDIIYFPRLKSLNILAISKTIAKLVSVIKQRKIQLLHANGPRFNFLGAMAAKCCRIPVIWHERTLPLKNMIDIDLMLSFLPERIICNSWALAERFYKRKKIRKKIRVIMNGVDTRLFNPYVSAAKIRSEFGIAKEELVVGIIGRIDPIKGIDYCIDAAAEICRSFSLARFLIVGDVFQKEHVWFLDKLKEKVKTLALEGKVIFCGFRHDMPEVFAACDICLLYTDAEACGRVLFEAMASAKAVVATNNGGTPEIVVDGETGILVPPKDPQTLAKALMKLLNDKNLARQMGRKGRERVEKNFTLEQYVKKTELVYEELLNAGL